MSDADVAEAVALAQGVALGEWAPGALPKHWKSGAASRAEALVHAPLLPSGVDQVAAGGLASLSGRRFYAPRIECEVALRLGADVSPAQAEALTPASAAAWVDAMAVAMEVVDSRWVDDAALTPALRLADFQVHGALVLGAWQPWRARDWARQRCVLRLGDAAPIERVGSHPLGDPAWLLPPWLRHLTRHGATVPAGTVVSTGSWTGCLPLPAATLASVAFDGLGELALTL